MNNNTILHINNLTKIYKIYKKPLDRLKESLSISNKKFHKDFHALDNVSFNIKKGDVVGIIGKNGSGKSTLLKIITGVLTPTYGSVNAYGQITALLELGAGFNPELSGLDNLYLSGNIMNFTNSQMQKKIKEIVEFSELEEFINQPVKTYSSGMKARLGFALAISVKPEILIVDEALSVGDVAFARKCYAKIEHLCKDSNTTVLFVSHSSSVIKQLCNKAIMLHNGKKIIEGNAKDVVNLYEKFMGSKKIELSNIIDEFNELKKEKKSIKSIEKKSSRYNPNLISKSKVVYEENGARISNIRVLDSFEEKSNILIFGDNYSYTYDIEFFDNYDNVKVAMFIKTATGIDLVGSGMPIDSRNIKQVKSGEKYTVSWEFKNIFNEGHFLFNCGVNSTNYGVKSILHRVLDAYMIKSIKDVDNHAKGFLDIGVKLKIDRHL